MDRSLPNFQLVSGTMRRCKSLEAVEPERLDDWIGDSIEKFSGPLFAFDESLPDYLRLDRGPIWIPMTCATIAISKSITGVSLDDMETLRFLENIHLLYRLDDFVETALEQYGIKDIGVLRKTLLRCFDIVQTNRSNSNAGSSLPRDSPMDESATMSFTGQDFLQRDMLGLLELLHQPTVKAAHCYNQMWYTTELREMLEAMIQQLVEKADPEPRDSRITSPIGQEISLRSWLHGTGAVSVGTKYQFAFLACLVSARDGAPCWQDAHKSYMAQAFAHHVSTSWCIWNDLGGRERDKEDGALTCVTMLGREELDTLSRIAEFEAECAILAQRKIARTGSWCQEELDKQPEDWYLLEFFRKAVHLSGEIYMSGDPTRSIKSEDASKCI